jgi:hypothetical protein
MGGPAIGGLAIGGLAIGGLAIGAGRATAGGAGRAPCRCGCAETVPAGTSVERARAPAAIPKTKRNIAFRSHRDETLIGHTRVWFLWFRCGNMSLEQRTPSDTKRFALNSGAGSTPLT